MIQKNRLELIIIFTVLGAVSLSMAVYFYIKSLSNPLCGAGTFSHSGVCEVFSFHEYGVISLVVLSIFSFAMIIFIPKKQ